MNARNQTLIGFLIGLLCAFLVSFITFMVSNPGFTSGDYFNIFVNGKILAPLLSVSLVGNLGLFFLFLKLQMDAVSKGILGATILTGVLIFIMKFV